MVKVWYCSACGQENAYDDDVRCTQCHKQWEDEFDEVEIVEPLPEQYHRRICTCQWSPVDTATIDPPHIVKIDRDCPHHGREAPPEPDPDEAYERKRDDAQFFRGGEDDYE